MMLDEVELLAEAHSSYRARVRAGTSDDRRALIKDWWPILDAGPESWPDRDWAWQDFGTTELHVERNAEWLVLADELEPGCGGDLLGVLVTTGPATPNETGIHQVAVLWLEYIAIAPSIRRDCPARNARRPTLKLVGQQLMRLAIDRSEAMGLEGRIGLHAEGDRALDTYTARWGMVLVGSAPHRSGGVYPVCYGDPAWAARFCSGLR
jgi:hypothetical protein